MDRDTARSLAVAAIKSSSMLNNLLPTLREKCSPGEYEELRNSIATIAGSISVDLLHMVFTSHPDLEREIDEEVRKSEQLR
jgi:hypothetical protein